ncbi:MAG: hypothetical protein M1827_001574 [Pycnora praestabilis]|nr:MAG: hypothetical protein M1827_001574 [Pycnora praestabilis]
MADDLSLQVEKALAVTQATHPVKSSTSTKRATSATSSVTGWSDQRNILHSQIVNRKLRTMRDDAQSGSGMARGTAQLSDEFGELVIASNR